ncbi:MAG: (d)CMP kinase, partial [Anaerolineae bacterium]|nr:(d)CMP kinase [Anaerolineae bacterium]
PSEAEDGRQATILVDGEDVTWAIRSPEVDSAVSPVSAYPGVRLILTERMRQIAAHGNVVMVGRDIGTVVLPNADLKLYLVASAEERAQRRYKERLSKDSSGNFAEVLCNIKQRDLIDSNRKTAPLAAAPDAILIDTTHLTIEEMYKEAERIIYAMSCELQVSTE